MPVEILDTKLFRKKGQVNLKTCPPVFSKSGNIAKPDTIIYSMRIYSLEKMRFICDLVQNIHINYHCHY